MKKNRFLFSRDLRLLSLCFALLSLSVTASNRAYANNELGSPVSHQDQASFSYAVATAGSQLDQSGTIGDTTLASHEEETKTSNWLSVSDTSPKQGETIKIIVNKDDLADDKIQFNGESYKLFPEQAGGNTVYTTLIAMPAMLKPGTYKISIAGFETPIQVGSAHFGVQRMRLPKEKDNFKASPGEKETMARAKKVLTDEKQWQGAFQKPVPNARMSTRFGLRRIVNGKFLNDYFHSGLDFAAGQGTPIQACAPGKVIVAHTGWRLHGNVVCLDHGRGVISIYIHMQKVNVKEGQKVGAGQVLGLVGKTGRASGPHLHFGIYVNNEASNPEQWFRSNF